MARHPEPLASIAVRLRAAQAGIDELKPQYEAALRAKVLPLEVPHAVERVVTDQRPVLDYLAHRLVEEAGGARTRQSQYPLTSNSADFAAQHPSRLPQVGAQRPDLLAAIEARQPYQPGYEWLSRLNALANDGKHVDLVPQTRTEEVRKSVSAPGGGSVSWGPGVTFSGNVQVMGVPIDPATQRPAYVRPGLNYTETTYVDWLLPDGRSALGSLEEYQAGLEGLVSDIAATAGFTWPL
jgi:hypothetical protein